MPKKNDRAYPLRGKVFCGCCRHAMPRRAKKSATFYCRYTGVDETAACHGLLISAAEFEGLLYEILSKQAQISLNLDKDICGDWNCSFGDNYYFTRFIRNCLFQTLSKNKIRLLTASQAQCIDHIAISERFFDGAEMHIEEWNHEKRLSDHKGILVRFGV